MKKLIDFGWKMYYKYQEVIDFIFWGGVNTVLNLILYYICTRPFGLEPYIANIITWILGTLFAFWSNKVFVFKSKEKEFKKVMAELSSFASGRLVTFFLSEGITILGVNILHINDFVVWFFNSAFIAFLNYLIGKFFSFKKKK